MWHTYVMKKSQNKVIQLVNLFAILSLLSASCLAKTESIDFRVAPRTVEITKMQEFHLQNAKLKIEKRQLAYAWGDLAYILSQIPNHHVALREMLELAPQLKKQDELNKYFEKAMNLYPDDKELAVLYNAFIGLQAEHQ